MKKILFILLCICPLLLSAQTLFPFKLKEEAKLYKKRKVKTIQTFGQKEGKEKILSQVESFNEKGQVTQMDQHAYGRTLIVTYEYNDKGLLTKQSKSSKDGDFKGSVEYDYEKGRLIHEKHNVKNRPYTITYHYDDDGHIDSSFISSVQHQRDVWHYNDQGKVSAILGYNIDDHDINGNWIQEYKEIFYYDKNGLLSQSASCFGRLCYVDKYLYNKKKQKTADLEFEGSDLVGKTTYEYDKKGLLQKIEYAPDEHAVDAEPKCTTTLEYKFY